MAKNPNKADYPIPVDIPGVMICPWCGLRDESGQAQGSYPGYVQDNFTTLVCYSCGSVSLVVADGMKLIEDGRPEMKGANETSSSD